MAKIENWTTQNTRELSLFVLTAVLGVAAISYAIGYVVWHALPVLVGIAAGVGVTALYLTVRNTNAPNL